MLSQRATAHHNFANNLHSLHSLDCLFTGSCINQGPPIVMLFCFMCSSGGHFEICLIPLEGLTLSDILVTILLKVGLPTNKSMSFHAMSHVAGRAVNPT